jgi:hypothetical protein
MAAHTARGKWQGIGFFCSLCEKLANTPHRSQTSDKLVTEHWQEQEPQVIPNTEATCINFYFPKTALILSPHSKLKYDMQFSHKLQVPSCYLQLSPQGHL